LMTMREDSCYSQRMIKKKPTHTVD